MQPSMDFERINTIRIQPPDVHLYGIIPTSCDVQKLTTRTTSVMTAAATWCSVLDTEGARMFAVVRPLSMHCTCVGWIYGCTLLLQLCLALAFAKYATFMTMWFAMPQLMLVFMALSTLHLLRIRVSTPAAYAKLLYPAVSRTWLEPSVGASSWRWFLVVVGSVVATGANIAYIPVAIFTSPLHDWKNAEHGHAGAFWVSSLLSGILALCSLVLFCVYLVDRRKFIRYTDG